MIEQNDEKELVAVAVTDKNTKLADLMAKFSEKGKASGDATRALQQAEAESAARPLLEEARSIATRHGQLRAKYLLRVETVNSTDWASLYRAVPQGLEMDDAGRMMIPKNHDALRRLQQAAADAASGLKSTFGDSTATKDELNAYSLADAASQLGALAKFGSHDPIYNVPSANFRRALVQANWWIEKSRAILAAAEDAIGRFVKAEAEVQEMLANVSPQADAAPTRQIASIPTLPDAPPSAPGGTSFTEFDPREHAQPQPAGTVTVTPVGAHDGYRVEGR